MADGFWKLWGAVKETSGKIYDVYKEDLQEFTSTLTTDTKDVIVQSSEIINNKIQTINKEFLENQEKEEESGTSSSISLLSSKIATGLSTLLEQIPTHTSSPTSSATIKDLVEDEEEKIVTRDPDNPNYKKWCTSFDIASEADHISNLITTNESLRTLYSSHVPTTVSYSDFWKRYFFHEKEKQEIEARRAALIQKATELLEEDDDDIKWDDDDDEIEESNNKDENESASIDINQKEEEPEDLPVIQDQSISDNEDGEDIEEEIKEEIKIEKSKSNSPVSLPLIKDDSIQIENNNSNVNNVIVITSQLETDSTLQNLSKLSIIEDYIPGDGEDGDDIVNDIIDSIEDWENIPTDDINEEDWDSWE